MHPQENDPKAGLVRALAETQVECAAAEHAHAQLLNDGADFMQRRYGAHRLAENPEALDHWSWHHIAMAEAREKGGLQETPQLPYAPAS